MNNAALVSRPDPSKLPQWSPASPGYLGLENGQPRNVQAVKFASAAKKYWWLVLLCWALVGVPISIWVYQAVKPQFTAVGTINVAPTTPNVVTGQEAATAFYSEFVRTQAELIRSPFVLQQAARDVRLTRHEHFRSQADQEGYLAKSIDASPVASAQTINVVMTHEQPAFAKDVVDSVIDAYLGQRKALDDFGSLESLRILRGLRDTTIKSLEGLQNNLNTLTADGSNVWSDEARKIIADTGGALRVTLAKLEVDRAQLAATLDNLKNRPNAEEGKFRATVNPDVDGQIEKWSAERIRLQMQDNVLESKRATPNHPDRIEIRAQLKTLDGKIAARKKELQDNAWAFYQANADLDKSRRITDASADLKALEQQIAAMRTRLEESDRQARDLGNKMQPILNLREQIADAKEALKRYNDRIEVIENQNQAQGRVTALGPTVEPKTPSVDKRPRYALAANAAGIMVGLLALFLLATLNNRIATSEDLPEPMQPLVVGTVSNSGGTSTSGAHKIRRKILGEEMRLVHANLLPPGSHVRRIMMVTSPTPGNGKTSIADQLATSLAKSGMEVLLIDGDLRKRDLSTRFDVGFRPGLTELLQGKQPELIQPLELLPNLRLMGAGGRFDRNPVELFQRKHIRECLDQLKDKFDCIVIDTPPTLVVADARLMASSCDEILCVVRANMTSQKDIQQTIEALTRMTGKTPKIIMNGVEHHHSYYKYKFAYTTPGERDGAAHVESGA